MSEKTTNSKKDDKIKNEKSAQIEENVIKSESKVEEEAVKSEFDDLKKQLEKAQKEHLYLRAEFDNYRKQAIKERSDLLKFGGEPLARDLLNVRDVFQKALQLDVTPENLEAFKNGVEMTEKEFSNVFAKHGIFEMESKEKPFDPEKAEALSQFPTSDVPEGHVYDVMRKGYLYHDKVLRHAQVVIATKPS